MFALARFKERVPAPPPSIAPIVPEYESDEPMVAVEVATEFTNPVEPMYAAPCVRLASRSPPENVEEAAENTPPERLRTVPVAL